MSLALELGARIAGTVATDIPPAARDAARVAIVDTLGVTLLGSATEAAAIVGSLDGIAAAPGPSLVLGTDRRTSMLDAALANGVASHALDYDDFTEIFGGHPSVPVLAPALALAEGRGASGRALVEAYVVGVEVETRIASGVHFEHYERGWHPTATLGVFGAAGACARLLHLSAERAGVALAVAASLASGIKANFGTMTKPLHVGHTARNGLFAALLAERGFTASLDAFEASQGFLDVFNGPGNHDAARILDGWLDPPLVVDPGISLKQYPCCGSTHPAVDAARDLHARRELDPAAIAAVEVLTHPRRIPHTDNPDPASALEAKFSMHYCVARTLLGGGVVLADFEGDAHRDPEVREVMSRTHLGVHPEMAARTERTFGAEVVVMDTSGHRHAARIDHRPGRGPDDPMTEGELRAKFEDCAVRALPRARVSALWDALARLESIGDVRDLTALAEAGRSARGVA